MKNHPYEQNIISFCFKIIYSLENCEGKTGLGDCVPAPLHEMFKLCSPQLAEEQLPHQLAG